MRRQQPAVPDSPGPLPLRDVFRQEQQKSDGNPAMAFIATLDELDRRMEVMAAHVETNGKAFRELVNWHGQTTEILNTLPEDLREQTRLAMDRLQPSLERHVGEQAAQGARQGIAGITAATEALRGARSEYEAASHRLTRIATVTLPVAIFGAILIGSLFGATLIRSLPASWQWTCSIIRAEHHVSADGRAAWCVIPKQ